MQAKNDADACSPQQHRPATKRVQNNSQNDQWYPVIIVQPYVEAIFSQIRRVFRHQACVVMLGIASKKPQHVRPPGTIARRVWVARFIGVLMVNAMRGYPENGSAFQGQRPADGEKILQD